MELFCWERDCARPGRVWILGQRVHHGAVGVTMVTLGIVIAFHDRHDVHEWFQRARHLSP